MRSTDPAADFVDGGLGPLSLKGPVPQQGNVIGLANAAIKDINYNTYTKALFVDLSGLSETDAASVVQSVSAAAANGSKTVYFLR